MKKPAGFGIRTVAAFVIAITSACSGQDSEGDLDQDSADEGVRSRKATFTCEFTMTSDESTGKLAFAVDLDSEDVVTTCVDADACPLDGDSQVLELLAAKADEPGQQRFFSTDRKLN